MSRWLAAALLAVGALGAGAWHVAASRTEAPIATDGAYAYGDDASGPLFRAVAGGAGAGPTTAAASSAQPIRVSLAAARQAMDTRRLPIVLPDGTRYVVRVERDQREFTGDWTLVGRVATRLGPLAAVLTFGPDGVFGTLPAPDGRMFHVTTSHGTSIIAPAGGLVPGGITRTDPAATDVRVPPPPAAAAGTAASGAASIREGLHPPTTPAPAAGATTSVARTAPPRAAAGAEDAMPEVGIDLVGIYTSSLVTLRGSVAAAETEFANLVAITNQVHVDSGTGVHFRIVGLEETQLPGTVTNDEALELATDGILPDGLQVGALRDSLHADLVAVLRPYPGDSPSCGIAWLNGGALHPEWTAAAYGVSVSNVAPCGPYVLAHELGHNLGSSHDLEAATFWDVQYGAFAFSFGHREGGEDGFATVMAYSQGEPWVGRFSDPVALDCAGVRQCGTANADNRRSIRYMASATASFREAPGVFSVADGHALEADGPVVFRLALSTPAPAGGVRYRLATRDATAMAGADYVPQVVEGTMPSGTRSADVVVHLVKDAVDEGDEHFELVVEQLDGATASRPVAHGRILDDDPRVRITGRLKFPPGMDPPGGGIELFMTGTEGRPDSFRAFQLRPPLFDYDIGVVPGYDVVWRMDMPPPFADVQVEFGPLDADLPHDIEVAAAARVRGRVLFDEGEALPASVQVALKQLGPPGGPIGFTYYDTAVAPDFEYDLEAIPGRLGGIAIDYPPAPFAPQSVAIPDIAGEVQQDIRLRRVPNASMAWYNDRERERGGDLQQFFGLQLSAPAPEGGVRITLASRDGTAVAGEDYVAFVGVLEYAPGEQFQSIEATLLGDDVPEADEWFDVVVTSIEGAWVAEEAFRFTILNDDHLRPVSSDVDGNGRSDLVWHSVAAGELQVWSMDGPAVTAIESHPLPEWEGITLLADYNGDGAADAAGVSRAEGVVNVWASYYDAYYRDFTYDTYTEYPHPGGDWRGVGQLDVDGDGRAEFLWQSDTLRKLMWWYPGGPDWDGTGERDLLGAQTFATAGDFDGDGDDDALVVDPRTGESWLWPGRPSGGFGQSRYVATLPKAPWNLVGALDIDGDGRQDLAWHDPVDGELMWWLMEGERKVGTGRMPVDPAFRIAATGDYNGDGRADLVWRDIGRTELLAWIGSAGGFESHLLGAHPGSDYAVVEPGLSDAASGAGGAGGTLHAADQDADGRTDLAWFNPDIGQFDWWRMRGGARTGLWGQPLVHVDEVLALGDLDGDGDADAVGRDAGTGGFKVLLRSAAGFTPRDLPAGAGAGWRVAAIADVDADGKGDIVWQDRDGSAVHWWTMDGAQRLGTGRKAVPHGYRLAGTGDLDGDGRSDLVWHFLSEDKVVGWLARDGGFHALRIAAWPGDALLVSALDADGDGDGDLAWHGQAGRELVLWTMDALAPVTRQVQPLGRHGMRAVAAGDLDADGLGDIAWRETGPGTDVLWLWLGTGGGFEERRVADYPARPVRPPPVAQ